MKRKINITLLACVIALITSGVYNMINEDWDFKYRLYVLIMGFLYLSFFYFVGVYLFTHIILFLKSRYKMFSKLYGQALAGITLGFLCLLIFLIFEELTDFTIKSFSERLLTDALFFVGSGLVISIANFLYDLYETKS